MLERFDYNLLSRDALLHEFFEMSVDRFPQKTAILFDERSTSYLTLEKAANKIASYIREIGIKPGANIVLMVEKCEFLYEAMLGILKAGCAYVPIDPSAPHSRVSYIAKDCEAPLIITSQSILDVLSPELKFQPSLLLIRETAEQKLQSMSETRVSAEALGIKREYLFNTAYIIYTSGTTGRPKGCIVDHKNVSNFIAGVMGIYGISSDEVVLQSTSISFDASVEEIWDAFACGGTLIPATKELMQAGPNFSKMAEALGITTIACTPTFISMAEGDISSLRLLVLGGEACPEGLVEKWARPGLTVFNAYGPTEATVSCIVGELLPGKRVVLGKPIPGYDIYILDDKLNPVTEGEKGEICVGGAGVVRGYLHMDEEDSKRFIMTPKLTGKPICIYRTGDIGAYTKSGDIAFFGRSDGQVKLRGFRIELDEIETVIMSDPSVLSAVCTLQNNPKQLVSFVILRNGRELDRTALLGSMKAKLPPYMIPVFLDVLDTLPTSISGKVDRKALPMASTPLTGRSVDYVEPRNTAEQLVFDVWKAAFGMENISVTDNFFLDLGGDSLFAAIVTSTLRNVEGYETISVGDIYRFTTIEQLAKEKYEPETASEANNRKEWTTPPNWKRSLCGVAQAIAFVPIIAMYCWHCLSPFALFSLFAEIYKINIWISAGAALSAYALSIPLMILFVVSLKWIFLGRIKNESYPLYGVKYFCYWFIRQLVNALPLWAFGNSPVIVLLYRLMGAAVGKNVMISKAEMLPFDLITIEDGVSIGVESSINSFIVEAGRFSVSPVTLKQNSHIGALCVVCGDNVVGEGAQLSAQSTLKSGVDIPAYELWSGAPASFIKAVEPQKLDRESLLGGRNTILMFVLALALPAVWESFFMPGVFILDIVTGFEGSLGIWILCCPLLVLLFMLGLTLFGGLYGRILFALEKSNVHRMDGWFYLAFWFYQKIFDYMVVECVATFGTMYSRLWLKLWGIDIKKFTELSYGIGLIPKYIHIGECCFLADDYIVSGYLTENGSICFGHTTIGNRSFIGNSAVVDANTTIPANCLIGVKSLCPKSGDMADGTSWFGSPALYIPARGKDLSFGDELTYFPSKKAKATRGIFDFFKAIFPFTYQYMITVTMLNLLFSLELITGYVNPAFVVLFCIGIYTAFCVLSFLFVLVAKWILIGRFKEGRTPLWSVKTCISDVFTGVYEGLVVSFYLKALCGTPFINGVYRLFGAKIGKGCFIDTTFVTEFDLINLDDYVEVNEGVNLQTHLFEDRVMKCGKVNINHHTTVASNTSVLYDTHIGENVLIGDNSLIMKGESLPANTCWLGIPAKKDADKKTEIFAR